MKIIDAYWEKRNLDCDVYEINIEKSKNKYVTKGNLVKYISAKGLQGEF